MNRYIKYLLLWGGLLFVILFGEISFNYGLLFWDFSFLAKLFANCIFFLFMKNAVLYSTIIIFLGTFVESVLFSGKKFKTFWCVFISCSYLLFLVCQFLNGTSIPLTSDEGKKFWEDNYVEFSDDLISPPKKFKNIIVLSIESMEEIYTNPKYFGEDFIPQLSQISRSANLGHYKNGYLQNWTFSSLFALQSGLYFNTFSTGRNIETNGNTVANNLKVILPNSKCLSDILKEYGYSLLYVQPGDLKFSNTKLFLTSHSYNEQDLIGEKELKEMGINREYHSWWGQYDGDALEVFKKEILKRVSAKKPIFAFYSSVDTHSGEFPFDIPHKYDNRFKNVHYNSSKIFADFVEWVKLQDFYKDTVILLIGDHLRMGDYPKSLVDIPADRNVYNAIVNPGRVIPIHREFTQFDLFPTILDLLNFKIKSDRLRLGTSVLSNRATLIESYNSASLELKLKQTLIPSLYLWR